MRLHEFIIEGVPTSGKFLYHVTNPLNLLSIIEEGQLSVEWAVGEPTISFTRDEDYRVQSGSVAQIIFRRSVLESMFDLEPHTYKYTNPDGSESETDESEERVHGDVPFNNELVSSVTLIGDISDSVRYTSDGRVTVSGKTNEKEILKGLARLKIPVVRK